MFVARTLRLHFRVTFIHFLFFPTERNHHEQTYLFPIRHRPN